MLGYILMGTVGVAIVPRPSQTSQVLLPWFEDMTYPLGTDNAGRPLLQMIVHATPAMLQLMLGGALLSSLLGIAVGTAAGYKMGMTDRILMTITDTAMNLPGLPLLIIIVAVLQPSNPFLIGVILSINSWPGTARSLRAQVLQLRSEEYVEAARAMGVSTSRNIQKNVLPTLLPIITLGFLGSMRGIIYAAVGLYYLRILPTNYLNWGVMLNQAYTSVNFASYRNIHYLMVPLIVISMIGVGAIMVAQAFDRVFNPRLRARYASTVVGGSEGDGEEDVTDPKALEAMAR